MDKQERGFTVWLNAVLLPSEEGLTGADSLATLQLAARVRALLWKLYSEDEGVINVMLRLEKRIDDSFLRMKEEVGASGKCSFKHLRPALHVTLYHTDSLPSKSPVPSWGKCLIGMQPASR